MIQKDAYHTKQLVFAQRDVTPTAPPGEAMGVRQRPGVGGPYGVTGPWTDRSLEYEGEISPWEIQPMVTDEANIAVVTKA